MKKRNGMELLALWIDPEIKDNFRKSCEQLEGKKMSKVIKEMINNYITQAKEEK